MSTPRDGKPYIWPSLITGLLSGEKQCRWASWFKAHFFYQKVEDDNFDADGWRAAHNELLVRRAEELKADGWTVRLEDQNKFKVEGQTAILSPKPDIVATKELVNEDTGEVTQVALVSDAKTGKRRASDSWQVKIYMDLYQKHRRQLRIPVDVIHGEVVYRDAVVPVPAHEFTDGDRNMIYGVVRELAFNMPPDRVPSENECRWCDIPKKECPARIEHEVTEVVKTEDF